MDLGLRPIGNGEVLRRIIGKMVASTQKKNYRLPEEMTNYVLAKKKGGCEAGIHGMCQIFNDEETHGGNTS